MEESKEEEVFYTEKEIWAMFENKYLSENQVKFVYHYHRGEFDLAEEYKQKLDEENEKKNKRLKKLIQNEMMADNLDK